MNIKNVCGRWNIRVSIIIDVPARDLVSEVVREVLSQ